MQRIVEPELMNDKAQAEAYAQADFEQSDKLIIEAFDVHFSGTEIAGNILDLGCGPGNISFQFANRFPNVTLIGIDGSIEMIRQAKERKKYIIGLDDRITFTTGVIPDSKLPKTHYAAIVSNSLLHHLHRPAGLWSTINQYSSPGTKIAIMDLFRPDCKEDALAMVNLYAMDEPEILQRDFYFSLLAAFTPGEIEQQLVDADLTELKIKIISDRHLLIIGEKTA